MYLKYFIYNFVRYGLIDEMDDDRGLFELWESVTMGDYIPCIVTLDGCYVGETSDNLESFINDFE